jgi:hypothetical protein
LEDYKKAAEAGEVKAIDFDSGSPPETSARADTVTWPSSAKSTNKAGE